MVRKGSLNLRACEDPNDRRECLSSKNAHNHRDHSRRERNPSQEAVQYTKPPLEKRMELLAKLQEDMKAAMKSGDKARLGVIRMLISDVKVIDMQPNKPTALQAVESYAKKLRKSQEEYIKLGKTAEVEALSCELKVVEEYLPKKLGQAETETLVNEFLAKNTFTEKQVGQAMGMFIKQHGSQVDPGIVNPLIKAKLAGK